MRNSMQRKCTEKQYSPENKYGYHQKRLACIIKTFPRRRNAIADIPLRNIDEARVERKTLNSHLAISMAAHMPRQKATHTSIS